MSKEFVKVADVKAGDTLTADGGFDCIAEGQRLTVCMDHTGKLCVPCSHGYHNLDGQFGVYNDETIYVGFYKE